MHRALIAILAAAAAASGCGGQTGTVTIVAPAPRTVPALPPADPTLPADCAPQPNLPPVCTQGSGVQVEPVSAGDSCRQKLNPAGLNGDDGQWWEEGTTLTCGPGPEGTRCTVDRGNSGAALRGRWDSGGFFADCRRAR